MQRFNQKSNKLRNSTNFDISFFKKTLKKELDAVSNLEALNK